MSRSLLRNHRHLTLDAIPSHSKTIQLLFATREQEMRFSSTNKLIVGNVCQMILQLWTNSKTIYKGNCFICCHLILTAHNSLQPPLVLGTNIVKSLPLAKTIRRFPRQAKAVFILPPHVIIQLFFLPTPLYTILFVRTSWHNQFCPLFVCFFFYYKDRHTASLLRLGI